MKKIIVLLLVAVSLSMGKGVSLGRGECKYITDKFSLSLIKYTEVSDVMFACMGSGSDYTYYEVAFDHNLTYLYFAVKPTYASLGYTVTEFHSTSYYKYHYDDFDVRVKSEYEHASPDLIRSVYKSIRNTFNIPTKSN